jgi:hypothetical protein
LTIKNLNSSLKLLRLEQLTPLLELLLWQNLSWCFNVSVTTSCANSEANRILSIFPFLLIWMMKVSSLLPL